MRVRYETEHKTVEAEVRLAGETYKLVAEVELTHETWRESRGQFWGAPCSETMSETLFEINSKRLFDREGNQVKFTSEMKEDFEVWFETWQDNYLNSL